MTWALEGERKPFQLSLRSTAEDWAVAWLLGYGPSTRQAYARAARNFFEFCKREGIDPLEARRAVVAAWARHMAEVDGLGPATIRQRLAGLSSFYEYIEDEVGMPNPAKKVRRPRRSWKTQLPLSRDEVAKLLDLAEADGPRSGALVGLCVLNGLRVSEALSLRIERLQWRGGLSVDFRGKGGKEAVAPICERVAKSIEGCVAGRTEGLVFVTSTGRGWDRVSAWDKVRRLGEILLIDGLGPHDLRHAFITLSLDAGASLRDVQDAARHADPRTTRLYDDSRGALQRHPGERLARYLSQSHSDPSGAK